MMNMKKKRPDASAYKDHSFISRQTRIAGNIEFHGGLHVEGAVEGNIRADEGCLHLHGEVIGDINVPNAIINGVVHGNITCSQHIELAAGARVFGKVTYKHIEMMLGAQVTGSMQPEVEIELARIEAA